MSLNKINVGQHLTAPLALACRGTRLASDHLEKLGLADKCSAVQQHPIAVKVVERIRVSAEILWVALGFVLLVHGAQFKNLFLCIQVITTFCLDRIKESAFSIKDDVVAAHEKMTADAPEDSAKADAKAEAKPDNKHAEKRKSKNEDNKAVDPAELKKKQEDDAAVAKKMLKAVDSDKVGRAAFDVFSTLMACHMVMQGGSMQVIVVVHTLVKFAKRQVSTLFEFAGHEDMLQWMDLFVSLVLYVGFGILALTMAPLALAMNLAIGGAQLVTEHGFKVAEAMGKIESAENFSGSMKGLCVLAGLTTFGTMWQLWALVADSGMAWYFSMLYLPAVMAEFIVSRL